MLKCLFLVGMVIFLSNQQAFARSIVMTDIEDAGIYCRTFSKNISKFFRSSQRKCKNKTFCTVKATDVASRPELLQHRCTGFFVAPVCKGVPLNVETRNLFSSLLVSCKR